MAPHGLHPRIDICRILDRRGHDHIAPLPIQSMGNNADSLAGIFDECNLIAMGIDQPGG